MKLPEDNWLVKTISFLIGEFIFVLNADWMTKKQLGNQMSIQSIIKSRKNIINHKKQKKYIKRNQIL